EKLSAILKGDAQPADTTERLLLADLWQYKQRYVAAARFYADAFADPKLADDQRQQHRYNAACAAALAGCGEGEDAIKLTDRERTDLRQQALNWLQDDLATQTKLADNAAARPRIRKALRHWQEDADLAGVREEKALQQLPEPERKAWKKLWAEVDQVLSSLQ